MFGTNNFAGAYGAPTYMNAMSSGKDFNLNDMMSLIAATKGGNPTALLQSMAASNPQVAEVLSMLKGVSPQKFDFLHKMCYNYSTKRLRRYTYGKQNRMV